MSPSLLKHFLIFWHKMFHTHLVIFPTLAHKSVTSPRHSSSIYRKMVFRNQDLNARCAPATGVSLLISPLGRHSQGNICPRTNSLHTLMLIFASIYLYTILKSLDIANSNPTPQGAFQHSPFIICTVFDSECSSTIDLFVQSKHTLLIYTSCNKRCYQLRH